MLVGQAVARMPSLETSIRRAETRSLAHHNYMLTLPLRSHQMLTFYELDLGLNHVVRKEAIPTDNRANLLVQVPGGQSATTDKFEGPSGVLVCCEDHIMWQHHDAPAHRVPIPKRRNPLVEGEERGIIIVAAVLHKIKVRRYRLLVSHS